MRPWSIVVALFLSPILAFAADQQQRAVPTAGETIEVSIVNLDVIVSDKHGNRVHGLTKDDFTILEDGKPQAITNFAEYGADVARAVQTAPGSAPPPATAEAAPQQKRTIVVFLDRFKLVGFRREPIFAAVKKLLHDVVRPGDAVSIVVWRGQPITRQGYTDDLARLDAILDAISKESEAVVGANALMDLQRDIVAEEAFLREAEQFEQDINDRSGGNRLPQRKSDEDDPNKPLPLDAYAAAVWAKVDLTKKVAAFNSLLLGMSGAEGKKVLVLASNRLSMTAGLEFFAMGMNGPVSPRIRNEFDTQALVGTVATTANAAGVTVYPVHPVGLDNFAMQLQSNVEIAPHNIPNITRLPTSTNSPNYDHLVLENELPVLDDLAKQTGGLTAFGSDIVKLLPRVEDDFGTYYSIAYRATSSRVDRTRKLVVQAKNPAYSVRTRRELVDKSDSTKMRERVVANLFTPIRTSRIGVTTKIGAAKKVGGHRWSIPLEVTIPVSSLTTNSQPNGDFTGSFSIYVAWGGILGEISETTHRVQSYTIKKEDAEKAAQSMFRYDFELLADEKTNRISVGVLDKVGKEEGFAFLRLPPREEMITEAR